MKSTTTLLSLIIFLFFNSCVERNQTINQDKNQENDSIINCFELTGNFPNLTILNQEYYGKIFIGITFDSIKNTFETYSIVRSSLWNKFDKSVFSTFNSDTKLSVPDIYTKIINEIRIRVDSSHLKLKRKKNVDKCVDFNWVILPIVVK